MRSCLSAVSILAISAVFVCSSCSKDENPYAHPKDVPVAVRPLPRLLICTEGGQAVKNKTEWVPVTSLVLFENGMETTLGTAKIKGRGNTTWSYPKKPYALKLDEKASLLGMPSDKRWDLLANYIDRTEIRNSVAFDIAGRTKSLGWTPRSKFVELYLNDVHIGLYALTEHIKISKDRVNIKNGYLLELDTQYDEINKFKSDILSLPVQIKEPDEEDLTAEQFEYVRNFFNKAEGILASGSRPGDGWRELIDMDSFIDYWIAVELTQLGEAVHPKSVYMYLEEGGKLKAGPVWDFDWGTFRSGSEVSKFRCKDAVWYKYLFRDPSFVKRVKEKWNESKNDYLGTLDFIGDLAPRIRNSVVADKMLWPMTTTVNGDETMDFDSAVETIKNNFKSHLEWMDRKINAM